MPISRDQKTEILQELIDKFGKSKSVVFAQYRGLSVTDMSALRGKLREGDAEMKVAKKTLIGLGAKESGFGDIDPGFMEGPVAAAFSYEDPLSGIKILFDFSKSNENIKLLGGIIDGKVVGPQVIQEYAKLPSREELLAKLIGSMNAPVSGTVGLLGNLIAGFVRVINAYKETLPNEDVAMAEEKKEEVKKEKEEPAAEAKADTEEEVKSEEKATEEPKIDESAEAEGDKEEA